MYPTAEVRWFWRGAIPLPVFDWLSGWPVPPEAQPARVDRYARLPADMRDTVGIKLREGRVEVKRLQKKRGAVRVARGASGNLEHWRKRILVSGEPGDDLLAALYRNNDAMAVEKARHLARFSVDGDGQVVAVRGLEPGPLLCEFEVTGVHALGQLWWTVCFEASGAPEGALEAVLLRVATHVLSLPHPLTLYATDSLSYPRWLVEIDPSV